MAKLLAKKPQFLSLSCVIAVKLVYFMQS